MGAADLPESWHQDILARFAPVVHNAHTPGPTNDFTNTRGPTSSLLWQCSVRTSIYLFIVFSYKRKQFNKF
jgi:hypothetical protein